MAKNKKTNLSTQKEIREAAIEFVRVTGNWPTMGDLTGFNCLRKDLLRTYGTLAALLLDIEEDCKSFVGTVSYLPESRRELTIKNKAIYIITSHQNDTDFNHAFFNSLLTLKTDLNAKLIILPTFYQTRLAYGGGSTPSKGGIRELINKPRWSSELDAYYRSQPIQLNANLELCAGLNVAATAANPLSGFEGLTGQRSAIIAHPQIRWKYIATPPTEMAKVLMTTGSISKRNYTPTKAGAKGSFHHTNSALVVYVDGDEFWPFTVNADNAGGFYHLEYYYRGVEKNKSIKGYGLVLGDLHAEYMDPDVMSATWTSKNSLVKTLPIKTQVWHDVMDMNIEQSHHNKKDLIYRHTLKKFSKASLHSALTDTSRVVTELLDSSPHTKEFAIVSSNHHDHIYRYLNETALKDIPTAEDQSLYVELLKTIFTKSILGPGGDLRRANPFKEALRMYIEGHNFNKLKFLGRNDEYKLFGIDCSQHGDKGPNGSRGSAESMARSSYKNTIGHSHTPGIVYGTYQGGHCSIDIRNFNSGYSSWMHAHVLHYPNGKRTLVSIIKGRWLPFRRA